MPTRPCSARAPARAAAWTSSGADHVLFAADAPFCPEPGLYIRETIRVIEDLELTAREREQIYRGNAERLLKLAPTRWVTMGRFLERRVPSRAGLSRPEHATATAAIRCSLHRR